MSLAEQPVLTEPVAREAVVAPAEAAGALALLEQAGRVARRAALGRLGRLGRLGLVAE